MGPRSRATTDTKSVSVRQSPRKRKHAETDVDSLPQPSRQVLESAEVNGRANGDKRIRSETTPKSKSNVVVDEPSRSAIAREQNIEHSPEGARGRKPTSTTKNAKKPARNGTEDVSSHEAQSESELSSVPEDEAQKDVPKDRRKPKRKTKEEKEAESMPLAPRTTGLNMFVGAHVSIAKGVENAITNTVHIGANALAMFLQSQRKWENPDLKQENREAFVSACSHHKLDAKQHIVPHGSYLVNLAAKDPNQAAKSYDFFVNDLKRCEALGIRHYNFHPGATNREPLPDAIKRLAANLNKALAETSTVVPLLENMAGTETIIGSRFSDLAQIIAAIKPEYLGRIGICVDTCHTFAAGYDLRTPHAFHKTFEELDAVVGLKYLKAMHINDSKGMFGSKKDLHQNIGTGFLGLRAFHSIMNEPRLANIPLILETPCERPDPTDPKKTIDDKSVWSREIKLLESLIGMDPESGEYKKLEKDLADQGKAERDKMEQWQAEKEKKEREKEVKAKKKLEKAEQGQKSIAGMFGGKGKKKSKPATSSEASSDSD